jgi:hypothetical protein
MNADKRIVLIAPILPFRGGIAQHATMLKRALAEKSDLLALSYSRQYPGWLFPGESDQDPDYVDYQEPKTQYLLDSLNPISWWRSAKRVTAFDPDLIILPWWTVYWAPCYWVLIRLLGPVYRRRLLFLCHNVVDHEEGVLKRLASFAVLHRSSR